MLATTVALPPILLVTNSPVAQISVYISPDSYNPQHGVQYREIIWEIGEQPNGPYSVVSRQSNVTTATFTRNNTLTFDYTVTTNISTRVAYIRASVSAFEGIFDTLVTFQTSPMPIPVLKFNISSSGNNIDAVYRVNPPEAERSITGYQWQAANADFVWSDIVSATFAQYTPDVGLAKRSYLRLVINLGLVSCDIAKYDFYCAVANTGKPLCDYGIFSTTR